jgi:serine/threonine-protein phosphatase PP1 catalytic subunit
MAEAELSDEDLDAVVEQLLSVRQEPPGKLVNLEESTIEALCKRAKTIFLQQPPLLELDGPINIVGT